MKHRIFAMLLLMGLGLTASSQNICFRANNDFTSANGTSGVSSPKYLAKADFNNDGKLDILTANSLSASVSLFYGQGNGLFTYVDTITITPTTPTSTPNGIIADDFNGDGNMDFALAKRITTANPNVLVMIGDGAGNFTTYANLAGGNNETDLVSGDFDNDGLKDIVVMSSSSPGVHSFFKNNGTGFNAAVNSSPTGIGLPYYCRAVQWDSNVDANLDVLYIRDSPGRLVFMKGSGTGTFTTSQTITIGTNPRDVDVADLNGDGFNDAVVALYGSDSIAVMLGNGNGTYLSLSRYHSGGDGPQSLMIVDIDNDGDKDVMVANLTDFVMAIFKNDGAGNLTLHRQHAFKDPQEITVGNFNSDAFPDIVFTSSGTKTLNFLGNDGSGGFTNYQTVYFPTLNALPNASASADFNGDGNTDLVTSNATGNTISYFSGAGAPNFLFTHVLNINASGTPIDVQAGDFNGDGNKDILVVEATSNLLAMYPGNGSGSFGAAVTASCSGTPTRLISADLDADGDLDAIVTYGASNSVEVFRNNAGSFSSVATHTTGLTSPTNVAVGHFNADANIDFAVCNNGASTVQTYTGSGSCNFSSGASITYGTAGPDWVTVGDFNGDGNRDVAVCYGSGSTSVSVANGTGSGTFNTPTNFTVTASNTINCILAVDYNQDGFSDLAASSNGTHDVAILKGSGSGLTYQQAFYAGYKPVHLVQADLNGDNMPDLFVTHADATGGHSSVFPLVNRTAYITPSGSTTFCAGNSVNLTSTSAYSYLWSTLPTTQSISASTSGSYTVTTGNFNNTCSSVSAPVTVTVNAAPTISGVSGTTTICGSSSTTLTASSTATTPNYEWYSASSGGTLLGSNAAYTTPVLVASASYFVQVTDAATGCTSNPRFQVDVVIGDIVAPTFSGCPSDMSVNATLGSCDAVVSWSAPTASDNCGSATVNQTIGSVSGSTFPVGVHSIQYTATDGAANTSVCSFTITVVDNQAPVISGCPSNISVNATAGTCAATVSWTAPTFNDNCAGGSISLTAGSAPGSSFPVGVTTITYTATDASGNTSTCSFTVTVTDTQAPTISGCPSNISQSSTAGTCGRVVTWTAPTANDNCSGASISQTAGLAPGSTFPVGTTTITYTATDGAGLTATCSFTVTISDTENPTISGCPSSQTFNSTAGVCGRVHTWTTPTVSDNCSGASIVQTAGPTSGSTFPVGATTVTYTATDGAGNTATCSFTVTVNDTENPTLVGLPSNMTVPTSAGSCSAIASWTAPTGSDNCSGVTVTQTAGLASGATFPLGTTAVTYTATDASGNTATGSFNVTVVDNIAPTFSNCPANMTLCAGDVLTFTAPTATDNCTSSPTVVQLSGPASGSTPSAGSFTVIFRATDAAGNFTNCTFTVTVNAAPSVNFALTDDEACTTDAIMNIGSGTPSGGIYSGTGVSGSSFDPGTSGAGTFTITYTVTNGFGCTDQASDDMTVHASPTVTFTVNDNLACVYHGPITLSGGSPASGTYSGTGVSGGVFTPATAGNGTHNVTYSITDAFGCTGSAVDQIVVSPCTDVEEAEHENVSVYPNPNDGRFVISIPDYSGQTMVTVVNAVGQIVHQEQIMSDLHTMDLSSVERGIYFVVMELNGATVIERIVIER